MTSKYAIALYEKTCLWQNLQHCVRTMDIDEFRDMIGVPPGAYERGLDFERKVLEPAVLEVNGLSDMGVEIQLQRKHARARIHGVTLSWWKKQGDEFRAATEERNRSKVGRMARLRGEVTKVEALALLKEETHLAEAHAELAVKLTGMREAELAEDM